MSLIVDIEKKLGAFHLKAEFETGEGTSGLLGPSGCGKSMTLKCIAGIETPDRGHIELDGVTLFDSVRRIDLPPQKRHVGYLFQNYALFPNMTLRENILCGLRAQKNAQTREETLTRMIALMGLTGLERHRPAQLSGGEQQRAALARILVNRPGLLMLDEPFSALDSHLREKLQIEMKEWLCAFSGASLLVTHSRDEAYRLCRHIALMEDGRILCAKPTPELFADPGSVAAAALTGCRNIAPAHKAGAYEMEVPSWGVRLRCAVPVGEGLRAVGVHDHAFRTDVSANRFPVRQGDAIEEPFEVLIPFSYTNRLPDAPVLWRRAARSEGPFCPEAHVGILPENVLPLYE